MRKLEYAERKSQFELWACFSIAFITIILSVGVPAYLILWRRGHLERDDPGLWLIPTIVGAITLGVGVWMLKVAISMWRRRNIVAAPPPQRVRSLRWQWILPAVWILSAILATSMDPSTADRCLWIGFAVLWFAALVHGIRLHLKAWCADGQKQ